ncbi:sugar 3,4-ketoisomerase [Pseudoprevotella muciniphila]|nr:FdtA/QdtA family cupin domain-containing protein [Pseudoprevotella muciniphila]
MKQYRKEELLFRLPTFADHRGMLTSVQNCENFPFEIKRVFWIYDVPSAAQRGGHAHTSCDELLIAVNGSFDVAVDDGRNKYTYHMNNSRVGLFIPASVWCELLNFSKDCVCLVMASQTYSEEGYINSYEEFKHFSEHK